jgi:hypothetical protein
VGIQIPIANLGQAAAEVPSRPRYVFLSIVPRPQAKCGNNNEPLDKRAAVSILGQLFKRE